MINFADYRIFWDNINHYDTMKRSFYLLSGLTALCAAAFLTLSCKNGQNGPAAGETPADSLSTETVAAGDIAYFNIDEVVDKYDKASDLMAEFNNKAQKVSSDLERKGKQIQNDYQKLMENYQKGLVLQSSAEKQGQDIQARQDKFNQDYAAKQDELAQEQMVIQNNIMNDIAEYVRKYNETRGFRLILANQTGLLSAPVVIADPAMNITAEIIEGLNAEYVASK